MGQKHQNRWEVTLTEAVHRLHTTNNVCVHQLKRVVKSRTPIIYVLILGTENKMIEEDGEIEL